MATAPPRTNETPRERPSRRSRRPTTTRPIGDDTANLARSARHEAVPPAFGHDEDGHERGAIYQRRRKTNEGKLTLVARAPNRDERQLATNEGKTRSLYGGRSRRERTSTNHVSLHAHACVRARGDEGCPGDSRSLVVRIPCVRWYRSWRSTWARINYASSNLPDLRVALMALYTARPTDRLSVARRSPTDRQMVKRTDPTRSGDIQD